jgi:hypothetical protein
MMLVGWLANHNGLAYVRACLPASLLACVPTAPQIPLRRRLLYRCLPAQHQKDPHHHGQGTSMACLTHTPNNKMLLGYCVKENGCQFCPDRLRTAMQTSRMCSVPTHRGRHSTRSDSKRWCVGHTKHSSCDASLFLAGCRVVETHACQGKRHGQPSAAEKNSRGKLACARSFFGRAGYSCAQERQLAVARGAAWREFEPAVRIDVVGAAAAPQPAGQRQRLQHTVLAAVVGTTTAAAWVYDVPSILYPIFCVAGRNGRGCERSLLRFPCMMGCCA